MSQTIHPMAIVEEGAILGEGVVIEPFAVVKKHCTLGDRVTIKSHAYIDGHTTIGKDTVIWPGASIGTQTQDKKFKGETTYVEIGERCHIREYATINSSTGEGDTVRVGNDCLIMAYCHVAHHCQVGNGVVMSNSATLAGHVEVGDYAVIGGLTPVHQYVRIGAYAMVGGMSRIPYDVPPYTIGAGVPYCLGGINLVGLKRQGIGLEERSCLSRIFKLTYRSDIPLAEALDQIESEFTNSHFAKVWIEFCKSSKRGLIDLGNNRE